VRGQILFFNRGFRGERRDFLDADFTD